MKHFAIQVLTIAVLSILLTAPLGAIGISLFGPLLLKKKKPEKKEEETSNEEEDDVDVPVNGGVENGHLEEKDQLALQELGLNECDEVKTAPLKETGV